MALQMQQFKAMFVKHMIHSMRNWVIALVQLLVPMFFVLMACLIVKTFPEAKDSPALKLTMGELASEQKVLYEKNTTISNGYSLLLADGRFSCIV